MLHGWKHTAVLMALIAALAIAPCANCQPAPVSDSQQSAPGHDCCPKPSRSDSDANACTWLPAVYTSSDGKVIKADPHVTAVVFDASFVIEQPLCVDTQRHVEVSSPSGAAPPLYISNAAFLI